MTLMTFSHKEKFIETHLILVLWLQLMFLLFMDISLEALNNFQIFGQYFHQIDNVQLSIYGLVL